ncbi:MAG TPA: 16S rRNA (cytidine(1402)-2'-O)-methyltransferase [Vicinamibacterales bacterium]|jgi:16S rRNA (cytidine1402-2'-O)-methyltransferase
MPGTLYVVATPIGNLEDVTLRALRVLREVSIIAAEDTRRTSRLLQHYSISTPTTSLHAHNERTKTPGLVERLRSGESVALVSDAGTPVVSDPGARLVAAAHAAGLRVEPIPGASAAIAALSASGVSGDAFVFLGFPPARAGARRKWLADLATDSRPLVLYEAPHRIRDTLEDMLAIWGDRTIAIGRELTKVHEQLVVRPISRHLGDLKTERGEYTIVVAPPAEPPYAAAEAPSAETIGAEFDYLTENGALSRRAAIRRLSEKYGLKARAVYSMVEEGRSSGV